MNMTSHLIVRSSLLLPEAATPSRECPSNTIHSVCNLGFVHIIIMTYILKDRHG